MLDNTVAGVAAACAVIFVIVAIFVFNKFTNSVIEDDRNEEPKGSKWIKHVDAAAADAGSPEASDGDKKDDELGRDAHGIVQLCVELGAPPRAAPATLLQGLKSPLHNGDVASVARSRPTPLGGAQLASLTWELFIEAPAI
eukprot:CAMPEP_0113841394 /NCGR_PEP_ID=MMETSP0328-20130328/12136_1 /TAXON_ID=39455 /ORGANISM="Alexandrium minutum" /LENGTH=140 /DNA_ID=CAMNT_0000810165 /DNA_START=62 /DNA_END=486 /DNA_ORIENTATION=- /assembly_acc=CAM_ASM_000350